MDEQQSVDPVVITNGTLSSGGYITIDGVKIMTGTIKITHLEEATLKFTGEMQKVSASFSTMSAVLGKAVPYVSTDTESEVWDA